MISMSDVTVGIIGGTGQIGQLFKRFFERNNCRVLVSSRTTRLKPEDCAKRSDVVLVSVPIDKTVSVIKKVAAHIKKDALLMDTTSIKKDPVNAMLRHSKCEVIGMHPLFGHNVSSFKNQTIVLCPARTKKWLRWAVKMFESNEARVKIVTPEKHDQIMSIIQGLTHFSTLSVAHAMKNLGMSIEESLEYTSPVYKLRIIMIGRILNQDPSLYANIEIMNHKNKKTLEVYAQSVKMLRKIIEKKDTKEFLKYFNECAHFFGSFKKEAEQTSDYLIRQMVRTK